VAEIVVIPLTGLSRQRVSGVRRYLIVNAILFVCFSMLCGTATNLTEMILYRVGQGFTGGVMIPTALTVVSVKLPPAKRAMGMALVRPDRDFGAGLGALPSAATSQTISDGRISSISTWCRAACWWR